jgi:hypothetical protein
MYDWSGFVKEGAALAMAGVMLWRFERMISQRADSESKSRDAFLDALRTQRQEHQVLLTTHLTHNVDALGKVTETLAHLCEGQAVVAAVIQKCNGPMR